MNENEQERQQELIHRLRVFEQHAQNIQEQMEAVDNGINELGLLNLGLDELKGSAGKEMLSPLGRGIFLKAKIASEDLTMDIGGKNFVKKSIPEAKEIIEEQLDKLAAVKKELDDNLEEIGKEMTKSLKEFQEMQEDSD